MPYFFMRACLLLLAFILACGCTAWQPSKEVWKTTRGLWYTYVSPPASVDYDDKGSVSDEGLALSAAVIGIDGELAKLERVMQNADRPPSQEWLSNLFAQFPWLNGFAGVKYDGTILGQEPPDSMKQLDFIPLLYEDKKQGSRALRADAQPGPLGPEIMLATPLYDGVDFLGIVVAYFDMRSLMRFSNRAQDLIVLCPGALLWPGKYDFAATPMAGVDWAKVVTESVSGTCSNDTGTFYYMTRYLGNLPMVFGIAIKGDFPEGDGGLEQGKPYFPQEREKLPPPPMPERKNRSDSLIPAFEKPAEPEPEPEPQAAPPMPEASEQNVIRQGSRESMLLRKQRQQARRRQVQERMLEGENIEYEPPRRRRPAPSGPALDLIPDTDAPRLSGGRPSPFGPRIEKPEAAQPASQDSPGAEQPKTEPAAETPASPQPAASEPPAGQAAPEPAPQPSYPAGPAPASQDNGDMADGESGSANANAAEQEARRDKPRKPATLPGGRPSPFGPRN